LSNGKINGDFSKMIEKAITIAQLSGNKSGGTGKSEISINDKSPKNTMLESKDDYNFTDIDNEILQNYILNINNSRYSDIIFSKNNLYIMYVDKVSNKSFKFIVKPIYYRTLFTNNLNKLFTFRKKPEEVFPKEIANQYDNNNLELLMSGIYFYGFNEPSISFKYLPEEKIILPYEEKRKFIVKRIDVQLNTDTINYWARTYLSSPAYNKDYSSYENNITLSISDNNSDIISKRYVYDISIIAKSTNYIQLHKKDQIKILSTLVLNEEINNFSFITEIITQNSDNPTPSLNITADILVN
jgi:hypothetical protein